MVACGVILNGPRPGHPIDKASWAPDPPSGHWIRWFGWLIYLVLLVLMGVGLAGPFVAYFGLRQWLRVRRIEWLAAETQRQAEQVCAIRVRPFRVACFPFPFGPIRSGEQARA